MNFYVDKESDISYVYVHVGDKHIIVKVDGKNRVYLHEEYNDALNDLEDLFKKEKIESIREHIIFNLKHKGIDIIIRPKEPDTEGQQFNLF